jgi:hypothetical protein
MVEETMDTNEVVPDHLYNMKEGIHDLHPTTTAEDDPELHRGMGDPLALITTAEDDREVHETMVAQGLLMTAAENLSVEEARTEEAEIIRQSTGRRCRMI